MKLVLWVITDGLHEERLNRLIKSCEPYNVNVLCYGEKSAKHKEYFTIDDFDYSVTEDTYFTANFNRILLRELNSQPKIHYAQNHTDYTSVEPTVPDAVMIMNDDIEWEEGALAKLIEVANKMEGKWATINPIQVDPSNLNKVTMGGTTYAYPSGSHIMYDRTMELPALTSSWHWIPFCAPIINLETVKVVGLLDPLMKMWFSDSDWCARAAWLGYNHYLRHDSAVLHAQHGTINTESAVERMNGDTYAFLIKWGGGVMQVYGKPEENEEILEDVQEKGNENENE